MEMEMVGGPLKKDSLACFRSVISQPSSLNSCCLKGFVCYVCLFVCLLQKQGGSLQFHMLEAVIFRYLHNLSGGKPHKKVPLCLQCVIEGLLWDVL